MKCDIYLSELIGSLPIIGSDEELSPFCEYSYCMLNETRGFGYVKLDNISKIYIEFSKRIDFRRLYWKDVKMIMSYEKKHFRNGRYEYPRY